MGGQACVLYGAAEFSKDFDFVLLLDPDNLERFRKLCLEVQASVIAVPPFEIEYLAKGHAVHFRAAAPDILNLRIDIMCKLRGVDDFPSLWARRTTAELLPALSVELLSLPDLVQAKKTQRDKDWPMIRRLVDIDYLRYKKKAHKEQISFWLRELRSATFLIECVKENASLARGIIPLRKKVLQAAINEDSSALEDALNFEERKIKEEDRQYWKPLIKELEFLRREKRKGRKTTAD